jgi:hypothetical protein
MTDRKKIILGSKDVLPKKNQDVFVDIELFRNTDELAKEIIDNNFNILEQFNNERYNSLRFCIYGTIDSLGANVENFPIKIKTNNEDYLYSPKKTQGVQGVTATTIYSKKLSQNGSLSKNIFNKIKGSYYFLFELDRNSFINDKKTKSLILEIDKQQDNVYHIETVPFLYYDSEGNQIKYGTDTVDIDLNGNTQTIQNDFPFFYDIHWIRHDIFPSRPSNVSFFVSEENQTNVLSIDENEENVHFTAALDSPSLFGLEKVDVVIKTDSTTRNPEEDYSFQNQTLTWQIGEQYKNVNINLVNDLYVESAETLTFGFENLFMLEEGELNEFTLNILDSDLPTNIGFAENSQIIQENNTGLTVILFFETPINVPGQTIDVIVDSNLTTAIVEEDFENTGTQESPTFIKTINLIEGTTGATFTVEIYDDFKYEFTKQLVLKLSNPSQNINIIPAYDTHTINIEDSMVKQYTRYNFNNDSQNGFGIFRMAGAINSNDAKLDWANNNQVYGFTDTFKFTIEVVNKGIDIIYQDEIIGTNETVLSREFSGGYETFIVDLPSNSNLNEQNKKYTQSKYEFIIKDIEPFPGVPAGIFDEQLDKKFSDLYIPIQSLNASDSGMTEYYLASQVLNIKTRYKPTGGYDINSIQGGCTDEIQQMPIDININGTILLNDKLKELSNSLFVSPTKLENVRFVPERIDVSECVDGVNNIETGEPTEVSRTLLLPLKTPSTNLIF